MREFEINKITLFQWNRAICLLEQNSVSYRGVEVKLISAFHFLWDCSLLDGTLATRIFSSPFNLNIPRDRPCNIPIIFSNAVKKKCLTLLESFSITAVICNVP